MDDDTLALRIIKRAVDRTGRCIHTAKNREEALATTRGPVDFDLAVVDYCLPCDSGLQIINALHTVCPALPAVIYSGLNTKKDHDLAEEAGIPWFDKVDPFELLRSVESGQQPAPLESLEDSRRRYYVELVHQHGDNISEAARATGLARSTFQRNMRPAWLVEELERARRSRENDESRTSGESRGG